MPRRDAPVPQAARGQVFQVAAVLLLSILIVSLALNQAIAIPNENREIEFDHSKQVTRQLDILRDAVDRAAADGASRTVEVSLGTFFPQRTLGVNPSPATGSLRTEGTAADAVNVSIDNATATGEAGDFWNGTTRSYSTGSVLYRPSYRAFDNAPAIRYEQSVLANQHAGRSVATTNQSLVRDRHVSIVALAGEFGKSGIEAASIDLRPLSASTEPTSITNESGENVTITFATTLDGDDWKRLLADQMTSTGGHVKAVSTRPHPTSNDRLVTITLEQGVTYQLSLARVRVGTVSNPDVSPAYLVPVGGTTRTIPEGATTALLLSVRDRYNNPVSGVTVEAATDRSDSSITARETSGADGQVTLDYDAPTDVSGDVLDRVNVSFETDPTTTPFDPEAPENLTLSLTIDNWNPITGLTSSVAWKNPGTAPGAQTDPAASCSAVPCDPLPLTAPVSSVEPGVVTTFWSDNESVASFEDGAGVSDSNGEATDRLAIEGEGSATLTVSTRSGESVDQLDATVHFTSGFESGLGVWEGGGSHKRSSSYSNSGTYAANISGEDEGTIQLASGIDTSSADLVVVEYWAMERESEGDEEEDLVVEYLVDGGSASNPGDWQRIDRLDAADDSTQNAYERRARLNASAALHDDFRLRFRHVNSDFRNDVWYVDDVTMTTLENVSAP
jgi:archaellum component FlaF (FlaF/FlaG flagellin family)